MSFGVIESRMRPVKRGQPLRSTIANMFRLILPVTFLLASYVLAYFSMDQAVWFSWPVENPVADPHWWMKMGHLYLALSFFIVMMTNRAYGAGMALAQVLAVWAIFAAILIIAISSYGMTEVRAALPPTAVSLAFVGALFASHVVAIFAFDLQRGVPWFKAPLLSGLLGPAALVLVFYPFAYAGADAPWGTWMWMDFVVKAMIGIGALIPYYLLRGIIRPQPGLGGA